MRRLAIGCLLLSTLLPTAAFSRGGGTGGHHSASTMGGSVLGGTMTNSIATGGAAGTSLAAPGTNASGTALSGGGTAFSGGPALGTEILPSTAKIARPLVWFRRSARAVSERTLREAIALRACRAG